MDSKSMMMTQEVEEETPPVMTMAVTTTVSKTSEFEWKLTRLPIHFNAVEVIKFETVRIFNTYSVNFVIDLTKNETLFVHMSRMK
jgi:hypothetical protein